MTCKHQIALCKLHNCTACEYHGDEASCPFANHNGCVDGIPTFKEAIGIYEESVKDSRHRDDVVRIVRKDIVLVGLTLNSKVNEMNRVKFKMLISLMKTPQPDGKTLRDDTIKSHLAAFRSIISEWLEDRYSERGFELPKFSIPKFMPKRVAVQEVSDRTIRKVEIEMEKWLASGSESDRDAYIFAFFALYCGMRAGDICHAKWDVIKQTTAGVMIVYTPRKTLHSTGITVSFTIDNKTFCKIEPLVGKPGDYVIARHKNRTPRHVMKTGRYVGHHVYLRKKVNKKLSECGIGNDYVGQKKAHALRKYFETERVMRFGRVEAANACGHSVRIQERNYLGTMYGKVA